MYRRILCKEVNALNKVFEAIASWWEWMASIAMNFQFKDAVDIIIVAFLIYGVVKLVRETRAGQLVKGLFLLVVLFIISSYFNLVMVSRVLAYFFQFAFVAILIVFQPEIRKALEQVGRNNVGQSIAAVVTGRDRSYDRAQIRKAINAVVDGVGILQQLKMGALIVFERKTKLGDIIETGTQINCEPSGQIVGNIFFNKAPLHDGAMIIRDGMIHAAGCILLSPVLGAIVVGCGIAAYLLCIAVIFKTFGGMSGDLAGWLLQVVELVMLLAAAIGGFYLC